MVDLLGVTATEVENDVILSGPWAKRIRVGQHDDKVRVVFDLVFTPKAELPYHISIEENRLVVSFKSGSGFPPR